MNQIDTKGRRGDLVDPRSRTNVEILEREYGKDGNRQRRIHPEGDRA